MAREGLMDDCGYNFDVDEDSYNSGFKDGFLTAVDEFAEKLKADYIHYDIAMILENNNIMYSSASVVAFKQYIDEIAEQLKGE